MTAVMTFHSFTHSFIQVTKLRKLAPIAAEINRQARATCRIQTLDMTASQSESGTRHSGWRAAIKLNFGTQSSGELVLLVL